MALTTDRDTPRRDGEFFEFPLAAGSRIFAGALVAVNDDGWAVPAAATASLAIVGRAEEEADNRLGGAGDLTIQTRRGTFQYANSASADEITRADIGASAYVVDDQTVAKTNGSGARPVAGIIMDVDAGGVWVRI